MQKIKIVISIFLIGFILSSANAYKFNIDDKTKAQINGKVFAFFSSSKDASGTTLTDLSGGGEATEVEFKLTRKVSSDVSTFFEIEIAAKPIDDKNDAYFDDIFIGLKSKKYGKLTITKNTDDPFEAEIAETLALGTADFLIIDEPRTSSSSDNQVQYLSPKISAFNLLLGIAKKYNEEGKIKKSIVAKYNQKQYGINIGYNEHTNNNIDTLQTNGIGTWYKINNAKILIMYAKEDVDINSNKRYTGFGIEYKASFANLAFAYQTIGQTNENNKKQLFLGADKKIFTGVTVYAQILRLDNTNNEGNTNGIGVKFNF